MSLKGSNQHFTGAASELYVAYKATESGFIVSYPLFTQSKYDLLIDIGSKILKVQVKKATKSATMGHKSMSFSIFSDDSKSYSYLNKHTFEDFSKDINGKHWYD
jgi:hypothetical protein